jgi:hypothetical protein
MEKLARADGLYHQSQALVADSIVESTSRPVSTVATGDDRDGKNAKGSMVNTVISKVDFMRGNSCYTLGPAAMEACEASSSLSASRRT